MARVSTSVGFQASPRVIPRLTRDQVFWCVLALVFAASATAAMVSCNSMSTMRNMPMPGGWNMSMVWMRIPGQTWLGATASFLGMWIMMMIAMMLPSLAPVLHRYRRAIGPTPQARLYQLMLLFGLGYFLVWAVLGVAAFALGVALATLQMRSPGLARFVPMAIGIVVVIGATLQFTAWKSNQLTCCREAMKHERILPRDSGTVCKYGVRLGLHCCACCAGLTAIQLVVGVMDFRVMAIVAVAISAERVMPHGYHFARSSGVVLFVLGLFLIARATGFQ